MVNPKYHIMENLKQGQQEHVTAGCNVIIFSKNIDAILLKNTYKTKYVPA